MARECWIAYHDLIRPEMSGLKCEVMCVGVQTQAVFLYVAKNLDGKRAR